MYVAERSVSYSIQFYSIPWLWSMMAGIPDGLGEVKHRGSWAPDSFPKAAVIKINKQVGGLK